MIRLEMRKTRKLKQSRHMRRIRMRGGNSESIPKQITATRKIVAAPQVVTASSVITPQNNRIETAKIQKTIVPIQDIKVNIRNTEKNVGILSLTPVAPTTPKNVNKKPGLFNRFLTRKVSNNKSSMTQKIAPKNIKNLLAYAKGSAVPRLQEDMKKQQAISKDIGLDEEDPTLQLPSRPSSIGSIGTIENVTNLVTA